MEAVGRDTMQKHHTCQYDGIWHAQCHQLSMYNTTLSSPTLIMTDLPKYIHAQALVAISDLLFSMSQISTVHHFLNLHFGAVYIFFY